MIQCPDTSGCTALIPDRVLRRNLPEELYNSYVKIAGEEQIRLVSAESLQGIS